MLEEHLKIQQSSDEDIAVSGKTMGWPDFEGTPYLRHSRRKSALNHIFMSRNKDNLPFNFLTTTNCTIRKKNIIEAGFFDEDLSKYGWQDIEFGYRLKSKAKVTLKFAEKAIAYHHHYVDFSANCKRLEQVGRAAVIVYRKHPDLKTFLGIHLGNFLTDALFFPKGYTTRAFLRLISRLEGRGPRFLLSVCYELVFNHYYLKGVREGFEIEKERGDREKQRSISSAETSEE